MVLPTENCVGQGDYDIPLLLLTHPVHGTPSLTEISQMECFVRYMLSGDSVSNVNLVHDKNVPVSVKIYYFIFG